VDLLRHLRFFLAVAEHRHFGHAASALGMTQPPLSQGVQRLERELGQRLFHRDARAVRLTEAGSALLPPARRVVQEADQLVSLAHRWRPGQQVRFGLAGDLEERIPAILAHLSADGWDCAPRVGGTVELIDSVREGSLDLAVVRHPAVVDGLQSGEVRTIPTYLSAAGRVGDGQGLLRDAPPLVVPPRRHHPAAHDQLIDAVRRLGHSGTVIEAASLLERQAWTSAGHGVRLVLDERLGRPVQGLPPLRVRVVAPVEIDQRREIDHRALTPRVEGALS